MTQTIQKKTPRLLMSEYRFQLLAQNKTMHLIQLGKFAGAGGRGAVIINTRTRNKYLRLIKAKYLSLGPLAYEKR